MKKINVAIIGFGLVGNRRKKYISQNKRFNLKFISDTRFSRDFKSKNIFFFKNYRNIPVTNLDAVFITLPNFLAPIVTKYFLKKNIHVFCEKPPAKNLADIIDVYNLYKTKKNLKLKYGFNHRYHRSVQLAKKILDSKKIGRIINIRAIYGKSKILNFSKNNWRSKKKLAGGGILLDQGIHMLDLIRYLAGDFDEYKSFISNKYWNYDVEDNAFAIMRNKQGIIASIHSTATQWQHKFNLEIICSKGSVVLDGILSSTKTYGKEQLRIYPTAEPYTYKNNKKTKTFYFDDDPSWELEIKEFADVITFKKAVKYGTIDEAIKVMKMIEKIYKNDRKVLKI
tara:strand:- start:12308 stop:13324 length:1017 start_codon:yes stop_codon:yes gene_type:complete